MLTIKIGIPIVVSDEEEVCIDIKDDVCDVFYPADTSKNSLEVSSEFLSHICSNKNIKKLLTNAMDNGVPIYKSSITKIELARKSFLDSLDSEEVLRVATEVDDYDNDKMRFSKVSFNGATIILLNWFCDWAKSYLNNNNDMVLIKIG